MKRRSWLLLALPIALVASSVLANPTIVDLTPGPTQSQALDLKSDGSRAFFWSASTSGSAYLWKSDGTGAGTHLEKTYPIAPGAKTAVSLRVYATTPNGVYLDEPGGLFSFRNNAGTFIPLGLHGGSGLTLPNGKTIFSSAKVVTYLPLVVSDGTAAGTKELGVARPEGVTALFGNYVYFASSPGANLGRTDGATIDTFPYTGSGTIQEIRGCGTKLFFSTGATLQVTDGASTPTVLKTMSATALSCVAGNVLFFGKESAGTAGKELWISDGTAAGTKLLVDINPGAGDSIAAAPLEDSHLSVGSNLYFLADDGVHGAEPWVSDGTTAGTKMILDSKPGATGVYVSYFGPNSQGDVLARATAVGGSPKALLIKAGVATDVTSGFGSISIPDAPYASAIVGSRLLYQGQSYAPATGNELAIYDFAAPLDGDGGTATIADAGPPATQDAGPTSGDAGKGDASASDSGATADSGTNRDAGADSADSGESAEEQASSDGGCSTAPNAPASSIPIAVGISMIAILRGRRNRKSRNAQ